MSCVRAGGGVGALVGALVCSLRSKCLRAFQLSGQGTRAVTLAVVGLVPLSEHLRICKWVIKNFISF